MLIPRGVSPERSGATLVERGKVWVVSLRLLKGRARPTGNRARCEGPAVWIIGVAIERGRKCPLRAWYYAAAPCAAARIGNVSWV